ncbi:MAG: hypothetical protein ACHQ53_00460 [Polyangiales bacterium]
MTDSTRDGDESPAPPDGPQPFFTRRTFLKFVGASSAFRLIGLDGCTCNSGGSNGGAGGSGPAPDFHITLKRRDDFVFLHFGFFNMLASSSGEKLERKGAGAITMVVTHPSQHIYEEALQETAPKIPKGPVHSMLAGLSRVAFLAPDDLDTLDLTAEAFLSACSSWELSVTDGSLPPQKQDVLTLSADTLAPVKITDQTMAPSFGAAMQASPSVANAFISASAASQAAQSADSVSRASGLSVTEAKLPDSVTARVVGLKPAMPVEPSSTETALELPFRLILSPNHYAQFAHQAAPVAGKNGRVELWHTRLGVRAGGAAADESDGTSSLRTVRAVWTRDASFDPKNPCTYKTASDSLFVSSLDASDRIALVHQSSNFAPIDCISKKASSVTPQPIHINRLMLTALGGYLDSKGDWGDSPLYGITSWTHKAGLGRDFYVELHYSGVLYPFGHRAERVKITERKFHPLAPHTAYLWQREFILVREPVKSYASELRQLPFTEVHVKTLTTPDLSNPPSDLLGVFVPSVDGDPFRFHMEGLDRAGRLIRFEVGVVFVPTGAGKTVSTDVDNARMMYTGDMTVADLRGQRVAFATAARPDDTTFETQSMSFAEPMSGPKPEEAVGFLPGLSQAQMSVEALRHLANQEAGSTFEYAKEYLANEFGSGNEGELLMKMTGSSVGVDFMKDSSKSGGFIAPSLDITGLSRKVGPVAGDLTMIASNTFDPTSFLSGLNAKLFGVFDLKDVIGVVLGKDGGLAAAPNFITQALNVVEDFMQGLAAIQTQAEATAKELMALGESVDSSIMDISMRAETLVKDIAAIRIDEMYLDGDIDLVVKTDLPALVTSLEAAANLFNKDPIPAPIKKLSAGPLASFKKQLDQVVSTADSVASTLHDALSAYRTGMELAKSLTVRLDWRPPIQGFPTKDPIFAPNRPDALLLEVEARGKDSPGKPAGVDFLAAIEDFEIRLIAPATFFILKFKRIAFTVKSGSKPDVDVEFDDLVFDGVLSFVEQLRKLIPLAGFSDPPSLDVSTDGIKASFSLGLPNVTVGVFSLTNLSFSAGFHIPFIGNPLSVSFAFCKRESPFHLTVSLLGGGGFFGIEISPSGVTLLEAEFEFGAELSLDFGVASGAVSVMAGFYFKMESDDATLTGYFRIHGEVEVLGLIGVSITLYMELSYEFSSHKLVGRATLEVEVSIAFFSISVSISVERKFGGNGSDPSFEDVMKPALGYDPFADYVAAFDFAA